MATDDYKKNFKTVMDAIAAGQAAAAIQPQPEEMAFSTGGFSFGSGIKNATVARGDYPYLLMHWGPVSGYTFNPCSSSEEAFELIRKIQAIGVTTQIMLFSQEKKWEMEWVTREGV